MDECDQIRQKQIKIKNKSKDRSKWNLSRFVKSKARTFFRSFEFKQDLTEDESKHEATLNPIPLTTTLSVSRISRVEKINPRELIVHHVAEFHERPTFNYFQQKYKQLLFKPSLLVPKQYYQEILTKRTIPRSFETKSLSICSDLQSTWTQCARRLNREYQLTLEAIDQVKRSFETIQSNSPLSSSIKPTKVTFCLPTISKLPNEPKKIYPSIQFTKPIESSSTRIQIPDLILPKFIEQPIEEEATFTVETFYKQSDSLSIDENHIVVVQENTTEEQFNAVRIPSKISLIPKRISTTNDLNQSKFIPKIYSSTSRIKPPVVYTKLSPTKLTTCENRVKTMVQQVNTNMLEQKKGNRVNRIQSARTMLNSH